MLCQSLSTARQVSALLITSNILRRTCRFSTTISLVGSNNCEPSSDRKLYFYENKSNWRTIQFPYIVTSRSYAKGKDRKKEHKGKKKVVFNESQLKEVINVEKLFIELQRNVDDLKQDFVKHLTIRSAVGALDNLEVTFDGKEYTLQELAQIVKKNPKTIVVNMPTFPQAIPDVLKALQQSGLGLNPQQDGTTLYIPVPKVTKEHRESLAKNAKALFIKCRDSIKDVQNKYIKSIKNQKISEDLLFSVKDQITALSDEYILKAEELFKAKQAELVGEEK